VKGISLDEIAGFINETALFRNQWQFRPEKGESDEAFKDRIRPTLREELAKAKAGGLLQPQIVYGYFPANGDGDDLVIWTDEVMTPEDAFSFEVTVANDIAGIGLDRFDASGDFGSNDLSSLVQMDAITKFPDDPATKFLGENNTLSVMGQEVGHRWLAFLHFSDHNRQNSAALLGRDEAHWSFFFNADASLMEGHLIQDNVNGTFTISVATKRYSKSVIKHSGSWRNANASLNFSF